MDWKLALQGIATVLLAIACSNPEETLRKEIIQKASDKIIVETEWQQLEQMLNDCIKKNPAGIKIGTETIKDLEDLAVYLEDVKGCMIEGREPVIPVGLHNFYVLLENSMSMKGYIGNGNPNFAEPILALFECGDDETEFTTAYVGAKGKTNPEVVFTIVPQGEFFSNIAGGKFISGESSPLDKMLTKAVDEITPEDGKEVEDVFCFITDGILSGTNAEILANKSFTKNNLPILEKRIRDAVSLAQKRNMHCIVYRLETPFNGTYYDYMNAHHAVSGVRPYYMVLIGHQDNLEKIEKRLAKESNFTSKSPERFASYDVASLKTLTDATLRAKPGQIGKIYGRTTVVYDAKQATSIPVVFVIQLNLNSLPEYYQDVAELYSNVSLSYRDNVSGTEVKIPYSTWPVGYIEDVGNKVYRFTVSLAPEVIKKMSADGEMCLSLPGHQVDWYRTYSCEDDTGIFAGDRSTFALDKFMGGIMKGFGYEDTESLPDAIRFKFNVKKK